ncbi:MAG: VRR-NUC domain-containing protein [Synergistaceae bacterium]|nr:VRR-NUC domain-containing protein [Synergistaceae bacterium]
MDAVEKVPTEHEEQRAFVRWFRRKYKDVLIFAIPNGGARSPSTAVKLKAEGVVRGIPDLFIPAWGTFVEMKRVVGGRLSPEQNHWKSYLEREGYAVLVCAGCEQAQKDCERRHKEVAEWRT